MLIAPLFRRLIVLGSLRVVDAAGHSRTFHGRAPAPPGSPLTLRFHRRRAEWALLLRPRLALGEAYMNGDITVENGDILDLIALLLNNARRAHLGPFGLLIRGLGRLARPFTQRNRGGRSRRNVAHHYDLSGDLYDLFLDADRHYSCAYFADGSETLEQAQQNKMRHIAAKLHLGGAQRVLDIGSGWGGLAAYLGTLTRGEVRGITLSVEQLAYAQRRVRENGLDGRVRFELADYREVEGLFDRVVSVGMFEHVGAPYFDTFFAKLAGLLADDGVALLHTIGRTDPPGDTNPWIRKYIFPGGYIPALSETLAAVERAGLMVTDVETLRLHYAETLKEWRRRFRAGWDRAASLYDERFCRMWDFYLAASEAAFRHDGLVVFQIQLAKSVDALPMTRDYMVDWERRRAGAPADRDADWNADRGGGRSAVA